MGDSVMVDRKRKANFEPKSELKRFRPGEEEEEEEEDYDWEELDKQEEALLIRTAQEDEKIIDLQEYLRDRPKVFLESESPLPLAQKISGNCFFSLSWLWSNRLRLVEVENPTPICEEVPVVLTTNRSYPVKHKMGKSFATIAESKEHPEATYFLSDLYGKTEKGNWLGALLLHKAVKRQVPEAVLSFGQFLFSGDHRYEASCVLLPLALKGQNEAQALIGLLCLSGDCGTDIRGFTRPEENTGEKEEKEKVKEREREEEEEEEDGDDGDDGDDDDDEEQEKPSGRWGTWGTDALGEWAKEWFELATAQGNGIALTGLGRMFKTGTGGVKKNPKEAIRLFKLAAANGDANACQHLFKIYYYGKLIPRDLSTALHYLRLAAILGDSEAQYSLANFYRIGSWDSTDLEIEKNIPQAIHWYKQVIKQEGEEDIYCEYFLGIIYFGTKDFEESAKWLGDAANKGHPHAMNLVACFYQNGIVFEKDLPCAVRLFRIAVDLGDNCANFNLGWCFLFGRGVGKDLEQASRYFEFARKNGFEREAEGVMMLFGLNGKERDYQKAMENFKLSDIEDAQYLLGYMYENGLGVKRDLKKAKEYYKKAADQKMAQAQEALDLLV